MLMPRPQFTLTTPLSEDLRIHSMAHRAALSRLGRTDLELFSPHPDLSPEALLGQPVTVGMRLRDGQRFFHGHVARFGLAGHRGRHFLYKARLRPWPWFLTRTSDCRIFQDLSVPDIVKTVFEDHAVACFEFRLRHTYQARPYCVQYRETDHDFVARLLEEEGIYWHFEHGEDKHTLVLQDDAATHAPAPGCEALPYIEAAEQTPPDTEYVTGWDFSRRVRTGRAVLTSYDFERPQADLQALAQEPREHDLSDYEHFDFQGDYTQAEDGLERAGTRIEAQQARHEQHQARSNAHGLAVGGLFGLQRHPRADQNMQYLCVALRIKAGNAGQDAGDSPGGLTATSPPSRPPGNSAHRGAPSGPASKARRPPWWWARPARRSTPTATAAATSAVPAGCACRSPGPAAAGAWRQSPTLARR